MIANLLQTLRRLLGATSGVALLEFAFGTPVVMTLGMTGAETANWITVKMRVSQVALHIADNAARMGEGTTMQAKTISEQTINDVFAGARYQARELDLYGRGRVILSDLEPASNPNTTPPKYYIRWQRCVGGVAHPSSYGNATTTNAAKVPATTVDGIGPNGRQVTAMDNNATMFVEVYYTYQPLISATIAPSTTFTEIASMAVRDRRDFSDDNENGAAATHPNGIYKVANVTASTC